MVKAKLIFSLVSLGIYGLYYTAKFVTPIVAEKVLKKRAKKEEKLRNMDKEAIDGEWRFVEEF